MQTELGGSQCVHCVLFVELSAQNTALWAKRWDEKDEQRKQQTKRIVHLSLSSNNGINYLLIIAYLKKRSLSKGAEFWEFLLNFLISTMNELYAMYRLT